MHLTVCHVHLQVSVSVPSCIASPTGLEFAIGAEFEGIEQIHRPMPGTRTPSHRQMRFVVAVTAARRVCRQTHVDQSHAVDFIVLISLGHRYLQAATPEDVRTMCYVAMRSMSAKSCDWPESRHRSSPTHRLYSLRQRVGRTQRVLEGIAEHGLRWRLRRY